MSTVERKKLQRLTLCIGIFYIFRYVDSREEEIAKENEEEASS